MVFLRLVPFIIAVFIVVSADAQTEGDSSRIFEAAKGTLTSPLRNCMQTPKLKVEEKYKDIMPKAFSYICKRADTVRAVFDGTVISINEVNGSNFIMTKYGAYYISYYGLAKPTTLRVGSFVRRNQMLGTLSMNLFMPGVLSLTFYKHNDEVDPAEWIK